MSPGEIQTNFTYVFTAIRNNYLKRDVLVNKMSSFFQNNKTLVHIGSEVIIFGIAMFVIYRKTSHLTQKMNELENKVKELESIVVEQNKKINEIVAKQRSPPYTQQMHNTSQFQGFQPHQITPFPSRPVHVNSFPVQHEIQLNSQDYQNTITVQQQPKKVHFDDEDNKQKVDLRQPIVRETVSIVPSQNKSTLEIVEEESDELDRILAEELEELKKN